MRGVDLAGISCYQVAMSEVGLELLEKVMALEPEERRAIVDELFVRVHGADEDEEILRVANERWEHLQKNPTAWIGHEDLMRSLGD